MTTLLAAGGPAAIAQNLVAGGLTALPPVQLSSNLAQNPGFESNSGGVPTGWTGGGGWALDQLVTHSGSFSYRWTSGAPSSDQPIFLKAGIYNFSAWIKTQNVGSGNAGIRLQVDFRPGGVGQWFTTDPIQGTADWTRYEIKNVVVPQDLQAALRLENFAGATGTAWFDDVSMTQALPQPVDVFMLYPNYRGMLFDDQSQTMRFDVTVTPPGGDFGRVRIRGALKDEATGQVLVTQDFGASANFVAQLDGSAMQAGRAYQAVFSVIDASSGAVTYTYPAYRVSKVAGSARASMNISFDDKNRLLVKGKPRFVLGVYDSGMGYGTTDAFWENALWSDTGDRRMNGLRINFYLNYWYGAAPGNAMDPLMANLQKHGVVYLQTGNCFDKFPVDNTFLINSSDAYIADIGSQPGSAGYYTIDECRAELAASGFAQYDRLRRLDPDSMTFAALLPQPDAGLWRDAVDVLSTDPYPMFGAEPAGGYRMSFVADGARIARNAVKDARPWMTVLQFFQFTSQGRFPTGAEMRNHAYMAIVEGAHGLWWWSLGGGALADVCANWCAERVGHMNDLKALVGELADLEPVLIADDSPNALTGNSDTTNIKTKVKVIGGKGYLFAYNYSGSSVTPTFTWNTAPGSITVNNEGRTLNAGGNSFSDAFAPYQAHVYVIANGGVAGTPAPPTGSTGTPAGLTVGFTNPPAGTLLNGTVTVTMSATGGTGVTYQLKVDGSTIFTGTNPTTSWNTTTVKNGAHTLSATATDATGKTGSANLSVNVANGATPPPPGSPPSSTPSTPGSTPSTGGAWITCANENDTCAFAGTQEVRYGAGTSFTAPRTFTNGVACNNAVFGDPAFGTTKHCERRDPSGSTSTSTPAPPTASSSTPSTGGTWITCANENDTCAFAGTQEVRYGAGTSFTAPRTFTNGVACNNSVFGDPAFGTTKHCERRDPTGSASTSTPAPPAAPSSTPSTGGAWINCAAENDTCAFSGTQEVRYGAGTSFTTPRTFTNGVACNNAVFGDPAFGTTKHCERRDPTGSTASAPAAGSAPAATGTLNVAITQPTDASIVSGTTWVVMWVNGASGTSNTYTLTVDGAVVTTSVGGSGPVTVPWPTTNNSNGPHTVRAIVQDASGNTGSASINVTVSN